MRGPEENPGLRGGRHRQDDQSYRSLRDGTCFSWLPGTSYLATFISPFGTTNRQYLSTFSKPHQRPDSRTRTRTTTRTRTKRNWKTGEP